jgi:hypothetical protein
MNDDSEIISDELYESAIERYNREFERSHHLDTKTGTQIGFSGLILSILGFVLFAGSFPEISGLGLGIFVLAFCILLLSMVFGIAALTKFKKTIPVFNPEGFYKNHKSENEKEQKKQIFLVFLDLIHYIEKANERDAKLLYCGNVAILIGLATTLISFIIILKII